MKTMKKTKTIFNYVVMEKHLKEAIKYVEINLLDIVWKEKILLSLRAVNEMRRPIDNDIKDAIRDLLFEYGSNNGLNDDWFDFVAEYVDEEDVFWELDLNL